MKVWQLNCCEEYFMQQDRGLYISRERAFQALDDHSILRRIDYGDQTIVFTEGREESAIRPRPDLPPEDISKFDLMSLFSGYEFYNFSHAGIYVWGIYETEVVE